MSAHLSLAAAPWLLSKSASFLPAFSLVFLAFVISALSTGQGSFFIHQWYSPHTEVNPTSIFSTGCSSVVEFEVRDGDASRSSFIVQDCFGYPGFLLLHMKSSTDLLMSLKNFAGILLGIALNL